MAAIEGFRKLIDRYSKQIIERMAERAEYPASLNIYEPGTVEIKGHSNISLLEFALQEREVYYARLGRYEYASEFPIIGGNLPPAVVHRIVKPEARIKVDIGLRAKFLDDYPRFIENICASGDDPDNYGLSADLDTNVIVAVNERIHLGRHVAQSKIESNPEILGLAGDPKALRDALTNVGREAEVLLYVRELANEHDLNASAIAEFFRWIIELTKDLEVAYAIEKAKQKFRFTYT